MNNKELERRIVELERWIYKLYSVIKIIQKKTGIKLTETKDLLGIPPYDSDFVRYFKKEIIKQDEP